MKSHIFSIIKVLLLSIAGILIIGSINGQNPLDISSRLTHASEQMTNISEESSQKDSSDFNPLDIKKEPNHQKSKPLPAKEIKRNVNKEIEGLSKPLKMAILLGSIIFFVFVRNINLKGFQQVGQSFMSNIKLVEFKNSINGLFNTQIGLFYLFFLINIAYFLYLCLEKNSFSYPKIFGGPFLSILFIVFGVYLIKYITLMIVEYALSIRRSIENHLFSISIHNIILGIALFFINAFFAFTSGGLSSILMFAGLGSIVLFYLIRQVKGLQYLSEMRHFSFFHFFIYLCSCEISPLLIAAKMITG